MSVWLALDMRRRIVVMVSTVAMFAAILGLARMANAPNMALMYSGLEPASAGQVLQSLDQRGIAYEVRGTGIYVDTTQRDQLRLALAAEGLPSMSGQGYELLDSLTGFGTTAQMFDAAYWRAKEGELARTIQSSPTVASARVHIANATAQPFRSSSSASASVTAVGTSGAINPANARAMQYLVASAVAGLTPENVSVIDGRSGAVVSADGADGFASDTSDRAEALRRNVERLLEARVGPGNAVVELALETVNEREAITERTFDPDSRVAISSETEESSRSANDSGSGAVTVASNLPEGDGAGGNRNSSSQDTTTREVLNFEVSETRREVLRAPGAIKRLTVAVLVNGTTAVDPATGEASFQPRSDAELEQLKELVASAVGLDEARGDVLTLSTMELSPVSAPEAAGAPSLLASLNLDVMRLIQVGILSVVALLLGLFVVKPLLMRDPEVAALPAVAGATANEGAALPAPDDGPAALSPLPPLPNAGGEEGGMAMRQVSIPPLGAPALPGGGDASSVDRLKQMIESHGDETVEILNSWMEDEAEGA